MSHTPGPWFLEGNWDENSGKPLGGWVSSFPPSGVPVFGLEASVGTAEEIAANARLIAAAPDLLEMAKWAEAALAPFSKEPAEKSGIARLRAAIAKAEGK